MTAEGAKGILITPADSTAVVPAIEKARRAGVTVIALDTPTEPASAVDALFATDNGQAGELIGRYAKAKAIEQGIEPKIAMLDLAPGITSGELRHQGFLKGFGIKDGDPRSSARSNTLGETAKGEAGMQALLAKDPGINIVYTVNEPAAFGAARALKAAGRSKDDVILVSVDGGCDAIKNGVRPGVIDATAQQYPENMARLGVDGARRGGARRPEAVRLQEHRRRAHHGRRRRAACRPRTRRSACGTAGAEDDGSGPISAVAPGSPAPPRVRGVRITSVLRSPRPRCR